MENFLNKDPNQSQEAEKPEQNTDLETESQQGPATAEDHYSDLKLNPEQIQDLRQEIMQALEDQQ